MLWSASIARQKGLAVIAANQAGVEQAGQQPGQAYPPKKASFKPRPVRYAPGVGLVWPCQLRRLLELARFKVFKNINF